jgi:hypothetical protein
LVGGSVHLLAPETVLHNISLKLTANGSLARTIDHFAVELENHGLLK